MVPKSVAQLFTTIPGTNLNAKISMKQQWGGVLLGLGHRLVWLLEFTTGGTSLFVVILYFIIKENIKFRSNARGVNIIAQVSATCAAPNHPRRNISSFRTTEWRNQWHSDGLVLLMRKRKRNFLIFIPATSTCRPIKENSILTIKVANYLSYNLSSSWPYFKLAPHIYKEFENRAKSQKGFWLNVELARLLHHLILHHVISDNRSLNWLHSWTWIFKSSSISPKSVNY